LSFCTFLFKATLCRISITFIDKDGEEKHIKVPVGMSMLEVAHENDIELENKNFNFIILLFHLKILVFLILLFFKKKMFDITHWFSLIYLATPPSGIIFFLFLLLVFLESLSILVVYFWVLPLLRKKFP